MQLADRLDRLGTETAFAVSAAAAEWAARGNRVYPFHLGDIDLPTPANIVDAMNRGDRRRQDRATAPRRASHRSATRSPPTSAAIAAST